MEKQAAENNQPTAEAWAWKAIEDKASWWKVPLLAHDCRRCLPAKWCNEIGRGEYVCWLRYVVRADNSLKQLADTCGVGPFSTGKHMILHVSGSVDTNGGSQGTFWPMP